MLRAAILFLFSFVGLAANAQLCQGSLGDPVVNITFGSGPNYGPQLGGAVTSYTYDGGGCPNDGLYVISNSLTSCFSGSWHPLSQDHTPDDVNGYMMIVNASFNPGNFYSQTVTGLCAGTTYQLAAWLMNVQRSSTCGNSPINPKVNFKIETNNGAVLLDYSTGDIPTETSALWKEYGSYFTMPAGETSVRIILRNDAPGGCGNDLALDDITFKPCGPLITASVAGSSTVPERCAGNNFTNTFSSNTVAGNVFYQWQTSIDNGSTWSDIAGATGITYTSPVLNNAGIYLYRQSVSQGNSAATPSCRFVSNVMTVTVNPNPVLKVATTPICEGENLTLTALGGVVYSWSGPLGYTSNDQNPSINNATTGNNGKYFVVTTSDKGCIAKDSVMATVLAKPSVDITTPSQSICEGTLLNLNAIGSSVNVWKWTPPTQLSADNISNPVASPGTTTKYVVEGSNGTCKSKDSITISVYKKPIAKAGADKQLLEGQSVVLDGEITGDDVSIAWTPSFTLNDASIEKPAASPTSNTTYTLTVTSNKGCGISKDSATVTVYKNIVVPNAFSPNGDGINDTWNIPFVDVYPNATLSVFNRFGQIVYTKSGSVKPWDGTINGKPVAVGTYYYLLDLKFGERKFHGWVMILR